MWKFFQWVMSSEKFPNELKDTFKMLIYFSFLKMFPIFIRLFMKKKSLKSRRIWGMSRVEMTQQFCNTVCKYWKTRCSVNCFFFSGLDNSRYLAKLISKKEKSGIKIVSFVNDLFLPKCIFLLAI